MSTAKYLYDGEGNRVEQQVTTSGTTTTTTYVGDIEQVATTGGTSTTTTYYYAAGKRIALAVNGTVSYLASDLLGSATVTLDGSGIPTASQLYAPYGGVRYSNGTMPTDYGYTGQRADSATGLDYYNARYYDPTLGQFTSDDIVFDGLNRYGYVGGNPISYTDPSGHIHVEKEDWIFFGDMDAAVDVDTESTVWDDFSVGSDPFTITDGDGTITFEGDATVTKTTLNEGSFTESSDDWFAQKGFTTNDFTDEFRVPGRDAWNDEFPKASDDSGTGGSGGTGGDNGGNGGTGDGGGNPPGGGDGTGGNTFIPNPKTVDPQGRLTNGTYTINPDQMEPHMPGTALPGRSVFLTGVDAESAVLDAAQFADENNLWFGNNDHEATVFVRNGPVGVHADTGERVDWITVSRRENGFVHGWPSER